MGGSVASSTDDAGSEKSGPNEDSEEMQGLINNGSGMREAVYRVLYTVYRKRPTLNKKYIVALLTLQYIQLATLLLKKAAVPWDLNYDNNFWKWVFRIELSTAMRDAGFVAFCALFVVTCTLIGFVIGASIRIANVTKGGHRGVMDSRLDCFLVIALQAVAGIFFSVFYVSLFGVLITPLDCVKLNVGGADLVLVEAFPDRECTSTLNIVMMIFGGVCALLLFATMLLVTMAGTQGNPCSRDPIAAINAVCLGKIFTLQTLLIIFVEALSTVNVLLEVVLTTLAFALVFQLFKYIPYSSRRMGKVVGALHMSLLWICLLAFVLSLVDSRRDLVTIIMLAGWPVSAALGYFVIRVRIARSCRVARKFFGHEAVAPPDEEHDLHTFKAPHEVEIAARIVRDNMVRKVRAMVPHDVHLQAGRLIYLSGLEQFPGNAYLHLCYGQFLWNLVHDAEAGGSSSSAHVERARSIGAGWIYEYQIYVHDLEKKGADAGNEESAMDMATYMEFMNQFKLVLGTHKKALKAMRFLWKRLMSENASFRSIQRCMSAIHADVAAGDRAYRALLERYPKSSKLLRSYGQFLDEAKNDPVRATRYLTEADRLDEAAEETQAGEVGAAGKVDDDVDGVVVISQVGIIQMVNKTATRMFGYKKEEMMGKNVRMLMGPPYMLEHDGYLHRYNTTGVARVVGGYRDVEAKHKQGHQFPIRLYVNKVESNGVVTFMGIIRPREDDTASMVLSEAGLITLVNKPFQELYGFNSTEIVGKPLSLVLPEKNFGGRTPGEYLKAVSEPAPGGEIATYRLDGTHKNRMNFPISIQFQQIVAGNSIAYKATMTGLNNQLGIITIDSKGKLLTANKFVCDLFGYKEVQMLKKNISQLMPPPYSRFHDQYLTRYANKGPGGRVVGIPGGRAVVGLHADGSTFNMNLEVQEVRDDKGNRTFSGRITLLTEDTLDNRNMSLTLDAGGEYIEAAGVNAEQHIGIAPDDLAGKPITDLINLSQLEGARTMAELLFSAERKGLHPSWRLPLVKQPGASTKGGVAVVQLKRGLVEEEDVILANVWSIRAMEGLIGIADDGTIVLVNEVVELFFGYSQDMLLGENISKLMPPKYGYHHNKYLAAYKSTGVSKLLGTRRAVECLHRDGIIFTAEMEVVEVSKGPAEGRGGLNGAAFVARCVCVLNTDRKMGPEDEATEEEVTFKDDEAESGVTPLLEEASAAVPDARPVGRPRGVRFSTGSGDMIDLEESTHMKGGGKGEKSDEGGDEGDPGEDGRRSPGSEDGRDRGGTPDEGSHKVARPLSLAMERFLGDGGGAVVGPTNGLDMPKNLEDSVTIGGSIADPLLPRGGAGSVSGDDSQSEGGDNRSVGSSSVGSSLLGTSAARYRRCKSIRLLLKSPDMVAASSRLRFWYKYILLLLVATLIVLLCIERVLMMGLQDKVKLVENGGIGAEALAKICRNARTIDMAGRPGGYPASVITGSEATLCHWADHLQLMVREMYMGPAGSLQEPPQSIKDKFLTPHILVSHYLDVPPHTDYFKEMSVWHLTNEIVTASYKVCQPHNHSWPIADRDTRHWRLIMENGVETLAPELLDISMFERDLTEHSHERLTWVMVALFLAQVALLVPLAAAIVYFLVSRTAQERVKLYSVFMLIPRPILRQLASEPIEIDLGEDDSDEEDLDGQEGGEQEKDEGHGGHGGGHKGEGGGEGAKGGPGGRNAASGGKDKDEVTAINFTVRANKRRPGRSALDGRQSRPLVYFSPLVLFAIILSVYFGVVLSWQIQNKPLIGAVMSASNSLYYCISIAYHAQELVFGRGHLQSEPRLRADMAIEITEVHEHYWELLRGNPDDDLVGAVFFEPETHKLFFGENLCLREMVDMHGFGTSEPCLNASHPWYPTSNYGLDHLMWRYMSEARELLAEPAKDLTADNEHLRYLIYFSTTDASAGLTGVKNIFLNRIADTFRMREMLQIIAVVAIVLSMLLCWLRFVRRDYTKWNTEPDRVSDMLSLLPPGIKPEPLIRHAYNAKPGASAKEVKAQQKEEAILAAPDDSVTPKVPAKVRIQGMLDRAKSRIQQLAGEVDAGTPRSTSNLLSPRTPAAVASPAAAPIRASMTQRR
eukprot:jgi/Mesvir1/20868/Mv07951-RA.2